MIIRDYSENFTPQCYKDIQAQGNTTKQEIFFIANSVWWPWLLVTKLRTDDTVIQKIKCKLSCILKYSKT